MLGQNAEFINFLLSLIDPCAIQPKLLNMVAQLISMELLFVRFLIASYVKLENSQLYIKE